VHKDPLKVMSEFRGSNLVGIALFLYLFLFNLSNPIAQTNPASPQLDSSCSNLPAIPAQYGEVIFRCNEKSPNQIFIIGMSHRDTLTRSNASQTSRVQAEVYKIGDWLIHNQGLQLLLPEGFFKNRTTEIKEVNSKIKMGLENISSCSDLADFQTLQQKLADDATFVNAEMLLKASHPMRLRQVEDWALYESANKTLLKLVSNKTSCDYSLLPELDYLEERRIASMLQRIPGIVDDEFREKGIKERKAIFTIGMMHVHTIIDYLNKKAISIHAPASGTAENRDYAADLNLLKENFGIFVILPKTLVGNHEILKINGLDKTVERFRKSSLSASFQVLH
jgi:hypothetical protein